MCLIIKNKTGACAWLVVDPVQGYNYPLLPLFDSCTWIKCFTHPDSCLDFFFFWGQPLFRFCGAMLELLYMFSRHTRRKCVTDGSRVGCRFDGS